MNDLTYKIRPAARLIHTIGSDLIGDNYAALVELVKNSYDADASRVDIVFDYKKIDNEDALFIILKDDGHGMSFDTIINKWLVPATNDKLKRKKSPKKRIFQGRKGIGRFAASILGQELTLQSIDEKGEKSTIVVDWRAFKADGYLEDIELLVEKEVSNLKSGTEIEIIAKDETFIDKFIEEEIIDNKKSVWDKKSIEQLINELRKLISPFEEFENDKFEINLSFKNSPFPDFNNENFKIDTYPIIEYYDYRISGTIDNQGYTNLLFENNINPEVKQVETINTKYNLENGGKYCGLIKIDFRVFDREPEAIENLINKGLINPVSERYIGKQEARRMLNEVYGINIYKNFFRIRPYGNEGIDWLDLDKDRIQNFTLRISNNQIVGFITIEPEELSFLEEKSARDGLKENEYYFGLKELAKKALAELEVRRLSYRIKSQKGRKKSNTIKETLSDLFSFSDLTNNIENKLIQFNVSKDNINQITKILKEEEKNKVGILEDIEKTIAIYQGQATMGKIINFILHEGRKPIQFFNSETKVIERYIKHYKETKKEETLDKLNASIAGFRTNSKLISSLFRRINPLARQKRGRRGNFQIKSIILDSLNIFNQTFISDNIEINLQCSNDIQVYGWSEDLLTSMTNLLENSIYWLGRSVKEEKYISIEVSEVDNSVIIDYIDNGPGLTDQEIESDDIFEPGYSKKINGTGLGLAIAGEAINRLGGKLKARKHNDGAYFQIELNQSNERT